MTAPEISSDLLQRFRHLREEFTRFMLSYRFGMDEVLTKVTILREEFAQLHSYNPIENVTTRLKTPESVLDKAKRKGLGTSLEAIRDEITDIAGVRVTCSFTSDVYRVYEALTAQHDITVLTTKDYIATPKPNGYRSLHAIVQVPVFLSSGAVDVPVEVQFRTIAMDFWASLEHKIFYKYDGAVPSDLAVRLSAAADTAAHLDAEMASLHEAVHGPRDTDGELPGSVVSDEVVRRLIGEVLAPDRSES